MGGEGRGSITYGPKSQKISVLLFFIVCGFLSPLLLYSGLIDYAAVSDEQSMLQFKAVKEILAGSLGGLICLPMALIFTVQRLTGRPQLTVTPDQILSKKLWGKVNVQPWKNLEIFEHIPADINLQPLFIQAKLVMPKSDESGQVQSVFRIPANAFDVEAYALLNEINLMRAKCVGEEYVPQQKSLGEIKAVEKQNAILQSAKNRRRWGLWFAGSAVLCIFLSWIIEITFSIPKHPYENYTAFGSFVVGAFVASFKRQRAS